MRKSRAKEMEAEETRLSDFGGRPKQTGLHTWPGLIGYVSLPGDVFVANVPDIFAKAFAERLCKGISVN